MASNSISLPVLVPFIVGKSVQRGRSLSLWPSGSLTLPMKLNQVDSIRQGFSLYKVSQLHYRLINKFNMSLQPCKPLLCT